jgi:transcriptional regulator of aromatic amino acid metabolism
MFEIFLHSYEYLAHLLHKPGCLLIIKLAACLIKLSLFIKMVLIARQSTTSRKLWLLLAAVLICHVILDIMWVVKLVHKAALFKISYRIYSTALRSSRLFAIVYYSLFPLFIEKLCDYEKQFSFKASHAILLFNGLVFATLFLFFAITKYGLRMAPASYEFQVDRLFYLYCYTLLFCSIVYSIYAIKTFALPRLVKRQLIILTSVFLIPYFVIDFFSINFTTLQQSYFLISITTLLAAFAWCYCAHKTLRLRFLNFTNKVQLPKKVHFITSTKEILLQLSKITTTHELDAITKNFFNKAFAIPVEKVHLIIRDDQPTTHEENIVKTFLSNRQSKSVMLLQQTPLCIKDEIEFTHFYENDDDLHDMIMFMRTLQADVFLPLYEQQTFIGYIKIDAGARAENFFGSEEQDEMLVFTNYVSTIINLVHSRNWEHILQQHQELKNDLYEKNQEIAHYQETLRFLGSTKKSDLGILLAKKSSFSYHNDTAEKLLGVSMNSPKKHPLLTRLLTFAQQATDHKKTYTLQTNDQNNQPLHVVALPVTKTTIFLVVYKPQNIPLIQMQLQALNDPSAWHYALYLATTESGKLINQLIPSTGNVLQNVKIDIFKIALTKKAALLLAPHDDLPLIIETIHQLSLRSTLYTMKLSAPEQHNEIATKLFGITNLFNAHTQESILQKLNGTGTISIENVEYLSPETQEYLADFLIYGFFKLLGGIHKIVSDVRIICSTQQNLQHLVDKNMFSKKLFHELQKTQLHMPSVCTLSFEELDELADHLSQCARDTSEPRQLTRHEKNIIFSQKPVSLQEFEKLVVQKLAKKEKKLLSPLEEPIIIDDITDPTVRQAISLGKDVLKNKQLLTLLWQTFKNQSNIAHHLGVNRSTVSRRCKMYNLLPSE